MRSAKKARAGHGILDGLKWLGVEWDHEGPLTVDRHEPGQRSGTKNVSPRQAPFYAYGPQKHMWRRPREPARTKRTKKVAAPGALRVAVAATASLHSRRETRRPFQGPSRCGTTKFHDVSWRNRILQRRIEDSFCSEPQRRRGIWPSCTSWCVVDDIGHAHHARHSRRRPHFQYAKAGADSTAAPANDRPLFARPSCHPRPDNKRSPKRHAHRPVNITAPEGSSPRHFRKFPRLLDGPPATTRIPAHQRMIKVFARKASAAHRVFDKTQARVVQPAVSQKNFPSRFAPQVEGRVKRSNFVGQAGMGRKGARSRPRCT